jgi:hypothetical protein
MHIFHHRFIGMGLLMAALAAPHMAQATGFLSMLRDVPLAEGLVELPEAGIVFDKPQGRIVQMTATHHQGVTQKALMAFYSRSLPNLGWQARNMDKRSANGVLTFARQGEILRLTFSADLVIFDLTPISTP